MDLPADTPAEAPKSCWPSSVVKKTAMAPITIGSCAVVSVTRPPGIDRPRVEQGLVARALVPHAGVDPGATGEHVPGEHREARPAPVTMKRCPSGRSIGTAANALTSAARRITDRRRPRARR
jgi:hypothetical protein